MKVFFLGLFYICSSGADRANSQSRFVLNSQETKLLSSLSQSLGEAAPQNYFDSLPSCAQKMIQHQLSVLAAIPSPNGDSLLAQVDHVIAVRGANPNGKCGGLNFNRILYVWKVPFKVLVATGELSSLTTSKDPAGPHPGTDLSYETRISRPGMQFHTYSNSPTTKQMEKLGKRFAVSLEALKNFGQLLVEADLDYDWRHISNPDCWVRPFWGSVLHRILPLPRLFAEPAENRFFRQWGTSSFNINSLRTEVTQ